MLVEKRDKMDILERRRRDMLVEDKETRFISVWYLVFECLEHIKALILNTL